MALADVIILAAANGSDGDSVSLPELGLSILAAMGGAAAIWTAFRTTGKSKLESEKLRLEAEKLRRELAETDSLERKDEIVRELAGGVHSVLSPEIIQEYVIRFILFFPVWTGWNVFTSLVSTSIFYIPFTGDLLDIVDLIIFLLFGLPLYRDIAQQSGVRRGRLRDRLRIARHEA